MEIHCFDTFNNPIVDSSINVKINSFERLGWMVVESFEIVKKFVIKVVNFVINHLYESQNQLVISVNLLYCIRIRFNR